MPLAILLPLLMRAGAMLVFVLAVIVAGAANRSLVMVPAIAAVATLANLNAPRMKLQLGAQQDPPQSLMSRAMSVFVTRVVAFTLLFGFTVLIAAVFRETRLAREFEMFDVFLLVVPFALSLLFTAISMRGPVGQAQEMMADIQKAFAEMQAGQGQDGFAPDGDEDTFTVDGEFEDRTED